MTVPAVMAALAALVLCGAAPTKAQDWPSKPVKIITGFAAGGIGDLGSRLFADYITRTTAQQAIVENRTGAGGNLGMDAVAKSSPDGYTLGLALNGNLVINPFIIKQMPFDALNDLVPVAVIGEAPQMIAISTEVPAKSFQEFQALAKAKPGTMSYGSAGRGSLPHLSAADFIRHAGIDLIHVPYRGNALAMTDLMAGRIHMLSSSIGTFRAALDAGKIRLLLTGTTQRLPYLPDLPTSAEVGIPGYLMSVWIGVLAPAGTPAPVIARIHAMMQGMLKDEASKKSLAAAGLDIMTMSQPEFAAYVKADYARWEKIVKDAGVEKE